MPYRDAQTAHRISIYLEDVLVEGGVNANDVAHLVVDLQLEGTHGGIKVDAVEVLQEQDLGVSLASIARF